MLYSMIDINYNFTTEKENYWNDDYWSRNNGLGGSTWDPDSSSRVLRDYHRILWSRDLPNGMHMNLSKDLTWNRMRFGSDSIIVSFRYKNQPLAEEIKKALPDYKKYFYEYALKSNTIAGYTIFPKHQGSMNQNRGTNHLICDRWDLTLECIRRFYCEEKSPLSDAIEKDRFFYNLFVDFKGYIDFFFFNDCVSDDYSKVNIWIGDDKFEESGLPNTIEEYFNYIEAEMSFLEKRRTRIKEYCIINQL